MQQFTTAHVEQAREWSKQIKPTVDKVLGDLVAAGKANDEASFTVGLGLLVGAATHLAEATTDNVELQGLRARLLVDRFLDIWQLLAKPHSPPAEASHPKPAFLAGSINVSIPAQVMGCLIVPTELLKLVEQHVKAGGACCVACHVTRKLRCVAAVDAKPSAN